MKRILFLTLLGCVGLCTHVMAEEKKGDRDEKEKRSISHDPVKVEIVNDGVMIHFMASLGEVAVRIMDEKGYPIYEEFIVIASPQTYYLPLAVSSARYLIVEGNEAYYSFDL